MQKGELQKILTLNNTYELNNSVWVVKKVEEIIPIQ